MPNKIAYLCLLCYCVQSMNSRATFCISVEVEILVNTAQSLNPLATLTQLRGNKKKSTNL